MLVYWRLKVDFHGYIFLTFFMAWSFTTSGAGCWIYINIYIYIWVFIGVVTWNVYGWNHFFLHSQTTALFLHGLRCGIPVYPKWSSNMAGNKGAEPTLFFWPKCQILIFLGKTTCKSTNSWLSTRFWNWFANHSWLNSDLFDTQTHHFSCSISVADA